LKTRRENVVNRTTKFVDSTEYHSCL